MRVVMTMVVMAALAVSACGRKGDLQAPPAPESARDAPVERPVTIF